MNLFHDHGHDHSVGNMWDVTFLSASEAILMVATFVAIGLVVVGLLNYFARNKILYAIKHSKKTQPIIGALLGAIPGCGGTLFLVPHYNKGQVSFSTLVASFIATMGEVAFILLAINPIAYLWVTLFSILTAMVTGYILQFTPLNNKFGKIKESKHDHSHDHKLPKWFDLVDNKIAPTIIIGGLFGIFPFTIIHLTDYVHQIHDVMDIVEWVAFGLLWFTVAYYLLRSILIKKIFKWDDRVHSHAEEKLPISHIFKDAYLNLLYIIFWVFLGMFIANSIILAADEHNLEKLFNGGLWVGMLAAILLGFIPGCAPAIIVANLFTGGVINGSAFISNSIVQDGDAGFPLLAKNKKDYLWIKAITIIPGFLVGSMFIIVETFGTGLF